MIGVEYYVENTVPRDVLKLMLGDLDLKYIM